MSIRTTISLLLSLSIVACTEGGRTVALAAGPAAPINSPDTGVLQPGFFGEGNGAAGTTEATYNGPSGGNGGGSPGTGAASSGGNRTSQAGGRGTGTAGAAPVPEPGTMLLLGSGLAGLAGFALRRNRKQAKNDQPGPVTG